MARVEHDLTDEQWAALKEAWAGCAYCGVVDRPLERDCVLPLSRGRRYTLSNIAPHATLATPATATAKSLVGSGAGG